MEPRTDEVTGELRKDERVNEQAEDVKPAGFQIAKLEERITPFGTWRDIEGR